MRSLALEVSRVHDSAPGIRTLALRAVDGRTLPSFVPGSHLVLECGAVSNAYSLFGEPVAPEEYVVSVLRVPDGAGGSQWVHRLEPGDRVSALVPRSAFPPIATARKHLLVAGGIGVTPIVSLLRSARDWHQEVQVLYAFRGGGGAHVEEIKELGGDDAEFLSDRAALVERLDGVLREQPLGTHLYVCGPGAMIDAVLAAARVAGWPDSRLHAERFGIEALDPGEPFTVRLARSGRTVPVPSGTSLLEALEQAGADVPALCRQGVCGECRLAVSAGRPLHRDLFLSEEEKHAGDAVMPCVSRAVGPTLEVPL